MLENAVIRGTFEHLFNAMHFQFAIVPGQPTPATQHVVGSVLGKCMLQPKFPLHDGNFSREGTLVMAPLQG